MRHMRDVHTLAGPYAMDAISALDRARFERHLARCEECAREIASLVADAGADHVVRIVRYGIQAALDAHLTEPATT